VVGVLLVEVVVRLGLQLGREVFQDAGYQSIDGILLGRISMPDGDEV
jgi:hypothetical protein